MCERKGKSYRVQENHSITIKFCVCLRVSVFNVITVYILSTFWNVSENGRMSQGVRQLRTGFKSYVSLKDQETKIAR